jgi:septum formation protein
MTILLASGSPRRRELLGRLDVPFEMVPSGVEERPPQLGEPPEEYAVALARLKADAVAAQFPDRVVLGADTVVALGTQMLAKPEDGEDAIRMLSLLAGREHVVVTGVAVRGHCLGEGSEQAMVRMHPASEERLRRYVATGEPMDKAGAYAIQGEGGRLVASVRGCYETVVGLPLCTVARLLAECGVHVPTAPSCRHLT